MVSFSAFRKQLASPKLSWQICLLAIIGGLSAAMLIVIFTFAIKFIQQLYLTTHDNYTSLDALSRFDLPIIGALVILFFSWLTGYNYHRTGIPFVLHRLKIAYGAIPARNTFHQFIGGIVSLSTGFSVGKEGPAVHLGAAASSFLGVTFALPNNSIRTLCACGIAAGIAASFNTPIAAVLFVMEVILREYDMQMFIPIMLAAIMGSMVTSNIFGSTHDYEFISQIMLNHHDFLVLILLGILLGSLAALFNRIITRTIKRFDKYHLFTRLMIAALITGCFGIIVPHAMGTGATAVSFLVNISDNQQLLFVFNLLAAKLLMTVLVIGLGMPGGLVGPIIAIGAISGVLGSLVLGFIIPGNYIASDFALMGMAGFLAATLNAPLAALLTVVELSNQLEIMLPAMIVIASSCLVSGQLFKNKSAFAMQLDIQHLLYRKPPIETALQKIGVLSQVIDNVTLLDCFPNINEPHNNKNIKEKSTVNEKTPIIVQNKEDHHVSYYWLEPKFNDLTPNTPHHCQHKLIPLFSQATLAEAYLLLLHQGNGGVYIHDKNKQNFLGMITFEQIKKHLLYG